MKTALIKVDPSDDLVSLKDKLIWAKAPRALLLFPARGCELHSRLDFVLLRRAADSLGMQIAIITRHPSTRALAQEAGLPVFAERSEALRRGWRWQKLRLPRRRRRRSLAKLRAAALAASPQPLSAAKRLVFSLLALLAVLTLAAAFAPRAVVRLQPQTATRELTFTALISPAYHHVTASAHLPARKTTIVVGGELQIRTSGTMPFPKTTAKGTATFTNLTLHQVQIPAGLVIRSVSKPTVEFETVSAGVIPPKAGATVSLPIKARSPGTEGNRPANDLRIILSDLAFQATVTNPEPTAGGADVRVPAATEGDYRRAESQLLSRLQATALREIQAEHKDSILVLPSLRPAEVLERTFTPPQKPRQPSNTLKIGLRVRFEALVISKKDLKALARGLLFSQRPSGMVPVADSLVIQPQRGIKGTKPPYRWKLTVREKFIIPIDKGRVAAQITGRTPSAVKTLLATTLPLEAEPQIALYPRWWFIMPLFPPRIKVVVAPTDASH